MSYGVIYRKHYYTMDRDTYNLMIELEKNKDHDAIELLLETSDSINMLY